MELNIVDQPCIAFCPPCSNRRFKAIFVSVALLSTMASIAQEINPFQISATTNEVQAPPPVALPESSLPPRISGVGQLASPPPVGAVPPQPLLSAGPINFQPHVLYSLSYARGLQAGPGQRVNTTINEIDPGILLQIGNHWLLDYTPILRYYTSASFRDTWDNQVVLSGATTYRDWTFGFSQGYTSSSEPLVETAGQLDTSTYLTLFNATYRMGQALALELNANQNFQFVDQTIPGQQFTDWYFWSTTDWLNFLVSSNFSAAVGAGFQYDEMRVGPDMTSELFEGRLKWHVNTNLDLVAAGGVQNRQFLSSEQPDLLRPIFSLTGYYQVFQPTKLFVAGGRTISPSYFAGQLTENTTISGGVNQRLLQKLYLNVAGAYGKTVYKNSAVPPISSIGTDFDTTSVNVSLTTSFLRRATASIFYQWTSYSSTSALYNYSTTQFGLYLGYRF